MANEERKRILNMVKEGKISIEEAETLLESMGETQKPQKITTHESKRKFLRIRIKSDEDEKVNVNLPLSVARWALTMVPDDVKKKLNQGENPIQLEEIVDMVHEGMEGQKLVDINDEDGNVVEIYVD